MRKLCMKCNAEFTAQRINVTKCCQCRNACLICGHRVKGNTSSGLCYSCDRSEDPRTELAALKRLEERQARELVLSEGRPKRAKTLASTPDEPSRNAAARGDVLTGGASSVSYAHSVRLVGAGI